MNLSLPKTSEELHHAYLLEDSDGVFSSLAASLRDAHQNAETHTREFDSFGIDDSRELIHLANMRSFGEQFFIYRLQSCTHEAQNALLKLFEEPPAHTYFFFSIKGARNVLPTLRSRVQILEDAVQERDDTGAAFVRAPVGARLEMLEPIIKEKDTAAAAMLLQNIEYELYKSRTDTQVARALKHILAVRRVLHDKGASVKTLMESVALTV